MSVAQKYPKGDTSWFVKDRFGMFIHWGLYALPAREEWVRQRERLKSEDYQKYFDAFDPDLFDPKAWARAARAAGMKYFVVTAKHHEGFCLWDSAYTDYKATNTAAGKDLLREVVDAFRAEGLRVGLYYSLIDWHHPQFPVDLAHPQYEDKEFREREKGRDMKVYAQYMRDQVRELLSNYGKIDVLWFDFSYPGKDGKGRDDWESEALVELVRSLQPGVILDNRLDLPGAGDIVTPEQYIPAEGMKDEDGKPAVWEGCQTLSGAWGYHRDAITWKSPKMLVEMLVEHVSKGGNLLLNVGPTARGEFDAPSLDRLGAFADWTRRHGRAIYNCGAAPAGFLPPSDCRYTYNPETNRLYAHLFGWPFRHLHLPGMKGKIKYAQLLNDASEVKFTEAKDSPMPHDHCAGNAPENAATLELPVVKPNVEVPVVEIFLK